MTPPSDPFDDIFNSSAQDDRLSQLSARSAEHQKALEAKPQTSSSSRRRRHAAKGSRKTAIGLAVVSTLGLAAYLHQAAQSSSSSTLDLASPNSQSNTAVPSTNPGTPPSTSKSSTQSTTTTAPKASGVLADGSFTGISSMTRWGPVQVKITVTGGKIAAVDLPSYPSSDNRSVAINRNAIPQLVQSTLTAQSANVHSVSGATYTSASYKISLQSALDKSRAAG